VLAHPIKHSGSTSRRDTGIAADAVILLANILKRLEQEIWTSRGAAGSNPERVDGVFDEPLV